MGNLVCKLKEGNGERSTSECGVRRAIDRDDTRRRGYFEVDSHGRWLAL